MPKSDVPGELAFPTQPFPVKPPPLARVSYQATDLVTAADTTAEHVRACQELIVKNGGVSNAGPFTPWAYRADGAPMKSTLVFPGGLGGPNWGGTAFDRRSGFILAATQDVGALGWVEKTKEGSPVPYDKGVAGPHVRRADAGWKLAVPETTMGPAHRDQCLNRRLRLAAAARRHRSTARGKAEHRTAGARWTDRHRERADFHRQHRRQPIPRARLENRSRAVGDETRTRAGTPIRSRTPIAMASSTWRSSPPTRSSFTHFPNM